MYLIAISVTAIGFLTDHLPKPSLPAMRPSSSRRLSGRQSDSPRRDSANLVAETIYNPSLPSYAQTTISHTQRTSIQGGKGSIRGLASLQPLKAGTGKTPSTSRPASSRSKAASNPATPLKKRTSFVNIFRPNSGESSPRYHFISTSPEGDKSPLTIVWKKSPGYKSPKLIQPLASTTDNGPSNTIHVTTHCNHQNSSITPVRLPRDGSLKFDKNDEVFQSMFKDMACALQDVIHSNELPLSPGYSPDQLKLLVGERKSIPFDEWEAFVDCRLNQTSYYRHRLEIDHTLITKVLEVNNLLYSRCELYQAENDHLKQQLDMIANDLEIEPFEILKLCPCESEAKRCHPGDCEIPTGDDETPHIQTNSCDIPMTTTHPPDSASPLITDPSTFSTTRSQTSASLIVDTHSTITDGLTSPGMARYKKVFQTLGSGSLF